MSGATHFLSKNGRQLVSEPRPVVGEQQIAEVVAMWTGIPVMQIAADEAERLLNLEDELHRRVIGQDAAVQAVAKAVRRSRTNFAMGVVRLARSSSPGQQGWARQSWRGCWLPRSLATRTR